ncbi:hypothetical protein MKZ38_002573 [Zalerion maritima]|uniref:Major facilitator superfamily (MFS) profile domain-containing protein n=1 Tax=Zalerion maritima TaxID=339359 RepID=A0AAD5WT07_9PEZI|nr:hypothetical protein MKZ38_002573 [Zalerion maritima]
MEMNYTKGELEDIQRELHMEIIPGTEIMTDVGTHHFVKLGKGSVVLVPQPSPDKHDPLNWSLLWKTSTISAVALLTFSQGFAPLANSPFLEHLIVELDTDLEGAIRFTSMAILLLGFSNFIWVPMSNVIGRRPVYVISQVLCLVSYVLRVKAHSYKQFMAACVLNGIGSGPVETLMPTVIADIYFLHDRGKWNTLYWVLYMGSLMVAPIVSGAMTDQLAEHGSWRTFWWLNTAMAAFSIVVGLFAFPETQWHRVHPGEVAESSSAENVKDTTENKESVTTEASVGHSDPWFGKGSPSKGQFSFYKHNPNFFKALLADFILPWRLFTFPIVEFSAFVVSWSCSNFLILNLTQGFVFPAPPYNFTSQQIGFTNFAILAGAGIGLFTAGPLSDWVAKRSTDKNGGVREPEMRLPTMIPYVFIMIISHVVTAVGYMRGWPWEVIVVIGYTCAGINAASLPGIVSTYAVDSYKPVAGSIFVAITVNKNLWGYGMGEFIVPWTTADGYYPAFMVNMALSTVFCLFGIVFFYYGKTFRRWTRNTCNQPRKGIYEDSVFVEALENCAPRFALAIWKQEGEFDNKLPPRHGLTRAEFRKEFGQLHRVVWEGFPT